MSVEDMEARLCRLLHPSSGYAHAANILVRMKELAETLPHEEVIRVLDEETR